MPNKVKKETSEKKIVEISDKEYEAKIISLAKSGLTAEKIGEKLRQEGIHPKEKKVKISKILKENNLYIQPDLKNVEEKLVRIRAHFEKNKQDKRAKREKDRIASQVRKIKIYNKQI